MAKGRPKKKHGKMSARVVIKATPEKKARYEIAADAAEAESVSEWARALMDREADRILGAKK